MNRRLAVLVPVVPVLVVAAYVGWTVLRDGDDPPTPAAVDVRSSGPTFAGIDELAEASDRVVEGEVVAIEVGRAITDPGDPTVGLTTQLATVDVTGVVKGPQSENVVVEQEATLLDGTPITVDGVPPLEVGDRGTFFLIDGDGDQFPYTALTTPDGFVADGAEMVPG